jgi:hypothetical protein
MRLYEGEVMAFGVRVNMYLVYSEYKVLSCITIRTATATES